MEIKINLLIGHIFGNSARYSHVVSKESKLFVLNYSRHSVKQIVSGVLDHVRFMKMAIIKYQQ